MRTLTQLEEIERRFQPFLQEDCYTFIGPVEDMEGFLKHVHLNSDYPDIRGGLEDKDFVRECLGVFPVGTGMDIYVVYDHGDDSFFFYERLEQYIRLKNVEFDYIYQP